ncbi:Ribokinase-like protein [Podospora australis]|uniref:Ribokinase n=1 Tax=Podospora australis TaxID=1536484 RepID=A0AAN6X0T3_9PEZI|nr:Ribokinase-like protein [Podospora australis]
MSSEIPRITILGSLNMDLVAYVPHHPHPGETLTANSFATSPGGKGSNQAVACAKLSRSPSTLSSPSAAVSMVGAVGSDPYGSQLIQNLTNYGIDASHVTSLPDTKTGIALIVVEAATGQNRIIISGEANHLVTVASQEEKNWEWLDGVDLLIMQLEIPLETVVTAVEKAREKGVAVLLNPAPAQKLPEGVYKGLAHLIVNETEAAILGEIDESELDTLEGLERVSKKFLERGVENFLVTLGGRGVYYMDKKGNKGLVEAEKVKVVDTTAAGDTFVGRYALEVVKGDEKFDIAAAVKLANKAAAKTVEREGAAEAIPWRDEVA